MGATVAEGYNAGTALLSIVPDFTGLQRAVGRESERAARVMEQRFKRVDLNPDFSQFLRNVARASDAGAELMEQRFRRVEISPDIASFQRAMAAASEAAARNLEARFRRAQVNPDFSDLQRSVVAAAEAAARVLEARIRAGIQGGINGGFNGNGPTGAAARQGNSLGGALGNAIQARLRAALNSLPKIDIDADTSPAQVEIQRLRGRIEALSNKRIGVDIDAREAQRQAAELERRLRELGRNNPDIQVRTDAAAAAAALAEIQAQADRLNGRRVVIDVDSSSINTFSGRLAILGTLIGSLLPALVPIGGAAIVGIGAIGAASSAAIPAVGALILGLHGVGDALKNMAKVDEEAGQQAVKGAQARAQSAAAQQSAARAVESAERSLANTRANTAQAAVQADQKIVDARAGVVEAEKDAAEAASRAARQVGEARADAVRAAEDAADRVAQALRNQGDAERDAVRAAEDAADRVERALRSQADAERDLARAQESALDAQDALTQSRRDAEESLQDLELQVQSSALRQKQAVLDLQDAEEKYQEVRRDPEATAREREQARLRVEQAAQALKEIGVRNERLAEEQAEASRKGIEGSDEVTAAKERLVDATERVGDAERSVGDAIQGVVDARIDGEERVVEARRRVADASAAVVDAQVEGQERVVAAQQKLTDAVQAEVKAREDGAERVADANRRVTDAVAAQAEQQRQAAFSIAQAESSLTSAREAQAAAAAGTAVAASAAMNNLATSMAALSPVQAEFARFLYGLRGEVERLQTASAAGLLPGLQAGITALLPLMPVFEDILRNVGGALGELARMAGEALASPTWEPFFAFLRDQGGPLLTTFGQVVGNLATAVLPGLVAAFGPLAGPVLSILENLTSRFAEFLLTAQDNPAFQRFIDYVVANAPKVAEFLGSLSDAFVNIVRAMAPMGPVVLAVVGALADMIAAIPPPVLAAIGTAVLAITAAFTLLGPVVAFVLKIMALMAGPTGLPFLGAILSALGGPVTLIIAAIAALGAILVVAYQNSETFRDIVNGAFAAVRDFIVNVVWEQGLKPAFQAIADFWRNVLAPAAVWLWENVLRPTFDAIGKGSSFLWNNVIKPAFEALVWYYQNVVAPAVTWLWQNIFKPAFEAIGKIVEIAWAVIRLAFDAMVFYYRNVIGPVIDWLWQKVFKPAFEGIGNAVKWAWENVISPALNALKTFFDTTLGPAISRGVDAFTTAWDRIKAAARDPINFVIREIYTGGIKKLFDTVAEKVDSTVRLPEIKEVGFARGGWTGPGAMWDAAGIVHADEFVVKKSSRRRIERQAPGLLDHINQTGTLPALGGYALGGRVQALLSFAKKIQGMGYLVSENKALGDNPRPGAHSAGGYHYKFDNSGAIDVNTRPGTSKLEQDELRRILPLASQFGLRSIFMAPGHYNHAHFDVGGSGQISDQLKNLIGQGLDSALDIGRFIKDDTLSRWDAFKETLGGAWGDAKDVLSPFNAVLDRISGGVGGSALGQLTGDVARKAFSMATDWVKGAVAAVTEPGDTSPVDVSGLGGSPAKNRVLGQQRAALRGWTGPQWTALDKLVFKESSWDHLAKNPTSTAFGLFQFLDSTWKSVGATRTSDPGKQIEAGLKYIAQRYVNPSAALAFHNKNNWYADGGRVLTRDTGGLIPPGLSTVYNGTGRDEWMFTDAQKRDLINASQSRQSAVAGAPFIGEQHTYITEGVDLQAWEQRQRVQYAEFAHLGG